MSDTNTSSSDDLVIGAKLISYALSTLQWGIACAVAWSCSTIVMGIIMFIIMSIVMFLLSRAIGLYLYFKLDSSTIEGLGRTVNGVTARVTSMFTRKVATPEWDSGAESPI